MADGESASLASERTLFTTRLHLLTGETRCEQGQPHVASRRRTNTVRAGASSGGSTCLGCSSSMRSCRLRQSAAARHAAAVVHRRPEDRGRCNQRVRQPKQDMHTARLNQQKRCVRLNDRHLRPSRPVPRCRVGNFVELLSRRQLSSPSTCNLKPPAHHYAQILMADCVPVQLLDNARQPVCVSLVLKSHCCSIAHVWQVTADTSEAAPSLITSASCRSQLWGFTPCSRCSEGGRLSRGLLCPPLCGAAGAAVNRSRVRCWALLHPPAAPQRPPQSGTARQAWRDAASALRRCHGRPHAAPEPRLSPHEVLRPALGQPSARHLWRAARAGTCCGGAFATHSVSLRSSGLGRGACSLVPAQPQDISMTAHEHSSHQLACVELKRRAKAVYVHASSAVVQLQLPVPARTARIVKSAARRLQSAHHAP